VFSTVQLAIVEALEEKSPQTADELAESTGYSRRRLYNRNGIKELLAWDPPIVVKGPKPQGYMLADRPPRP
jgi:hypothetical protein